jgi:hypothetical protein
LSTPTARRLRQSILAARSVRLPVDGEHHSAARTAPWGLGEHQQSSTSRSTSTEAAFSTAGEHHDGILGCRNMFLFVSWHHVLMRVGLVAKAERIAVFSVEELAPRASSHSPLYLERFGTHCGARAFLSTTRNAKILSLTTWCCLALLLFLLFASTVSCFSRLF